MDVALSDAQILGALERNGVDARVVEFKDICGIKTVDELFADKDAVVVYVATAPSFGHWACVFKTVRGEVEAFDSSGHLIDVDLLTLPADLRRELHETSPCLMELLLNERRCPYPVVVNGNKLQNFREGSNTCGRHVLLRLLHRDLDDVQYMAFLDSHRSKGESYDQVAVALTRPILGV